MSVIRSLGTLKEGKEIFLTIDDEGKEVAEFIADFDIDCDGSGGNPHHDRFFQPHTTLKRNGLDLNAEKERFVVVPPLICRETIGKVLGSFVELTNLKNGKQTTAVVGDIGPWFKAGEGSPACAEALGLNGNPNSGGTDDVIIRYRIHVGVPAIIDGIKYQLHSF